ncbi:PPE domain-containing protein [Mycobacterium lepromatosis]|nr:PPE domain-containing protein [Mycobacterium lepromatosis]
MTFESALAVTVSLVTVLVNRTTLSLLLATNIFSINALVIAAKEFHDVDM